MGIMTVCIKDVCLKETEGNRRRALLCDVFLSSPHPPQCWEVKVQKQFPRTVFKAAQNQLPEPPHGCLQGQQLNVLPYLKDAICVLRQAVIALSNITGSGWM